MDAGALAAVLTAIGSVIGAVSLAIIRVLRYVGERDRYRDAREEILFRRSALLSEKLHSLSRNGIPGWPDLVFEERMTNLDRDWEILNIRGKA